MAIDASDGICVEVFEQWYPLKNTSAASGDKWHAILWLLPLTRVYRGVPRANATSHNVGVIPRAVCRASGKNTRAPSSNAALRPLNKWCITLRGYSRRSMRVLTAIPRGAREQRNYIWSSAKIRGNVPADTIDVYQRCRTRCTSPRLDGQTHRYTDFCRESRYCLPIASKGVPKDFSIGFTERNNRNYRTFT